MRQEERREGDHDQVVEEERPAGEEPGEIVRGPTDEGRRPARLGQSRGSFRVREGDDQEEQADAEQDQRRETERMCCDDPEREVDRRGDLPVRDGEQCARVQLTAQAGELAGHLAPSPQHDQTAHTGRDEEHAEDERRRRTRGGA